MLKFILKLSSVISIFLLLTGCNKGGNAPVNTNDKTHMLVDVMQHQLPWKFGEMGSCEQVTFRDGKQSLHRIMQFYRQSE